MKTKFFGALLFALLLSFSADAQFIRYHQLLTLPNGSILIGQGGQNTPVELDAALVPIDPITGVSATDVQGALAELQGDINASGDGWGADVVQSDNTLSGDGTAGTPLGVNSANLNTSEFNNDAGFITNANDADADPANELQTISKAGSTVTLSDGGGSFTDEVNDADADASNELNIASRPANDNDVTLSNGGGTFSVIGDYYNDEVSITGGASTVTLPATPDLTGTDWHFTRNGVVYRASTTDGNEYFYINGTTLQPSTGQPALADGEVIGYRFPR
ncbi:hypothetical protein [Lewinella sp. W8]|uniref:hypothetical protein n=1 Tax=Lewinella sp. W8 TaxID=2528208 RepID=UPI001067A53D|nr:hypothetical protein [Lewinella sp. W8]MTB53043.1 hypothetical protein [Lewinella sp. W8]